MNIYALIDLISELIVIYKHSLENITDKCDFLPLIHNYRKHKISIQFQVQYSFTSKCSNLINSILKLNLWLYDL